MNAKNRLIQKLLKVAKKHKILTYPVLALVALISIFSYFFDWSTGAGKRVVAVVMVMVMLVSQSYFLTSSATEVEDTTETIEAQEALQEKEKVTSEGKQSADSGKEQDQTEVVSQEISATEEPAETNPDNMANMNEAEQNNITSNEADGNEPGTEENAGESSVKDELDTMSLDVSKADPAETVDVVFKIPGEQTSLASGQAEKNPDGNTYKLKDGLYAEAENALSSRNAADKDYYSYIGWYTDRNCTNKVDSDTGFQQLSLNEGNAIVLYAKRTLLQYKVVIATDGGTIENVEGGTPSAEGENSYDVKKSSDGNINLTVNVVKTGYMVSADKSSVNGKSGCVELLSKEDDGTNKISIHIDGSSDVSLQKVNLSWEGEKYTITYAANEDGTETFTDTVQFGNQIYKWQSASAATPLTGYAVTKWVVKDESAEDSSKTAVPGSFIYLNSDLEEYLFKNQKTAVLVPHYEYREIEVDESQLKQEFSYHTLKKNETVITAHYKNPDGEGGNAGKFKYTITDSEGISKKLPAGISIKDGNNITISTNDKGPEDINISGVDVEFKIIDESIDGKTKEATFNLKIIINQKAVQIVDEKALTKVYDGDTTCDNLSVKELPTDEDGVFVTFGEGAHYQSAEVGNPDVILPEANLKYTDTSKNGKCTLLKNSDGTLNIKGRITPRNLFVKTGVEYKYGRDYVRAGEKDNPKLLVMEDETQNTDNAGLIEAHKGRLDEIVEAKVEGRDDDAMLTATPHVTSVSYNVDAVGKKAEDPTNDIAKNYNIILNTYEDNNAKAKFEVVLETPVKDKDYEIEGTFSDDGWYGASSAKILPQGSAGYDQIRTSTSAAWASELILTESNTKNGQITFQLGNSDTGAFTDFVTIDINVDTSGPQYVDYKVTKSGGNNVGNPGNGFYFPSEGGTVSFGHYFNNTITFEITYKDELSNPKDLYYTLSGTLGNGEQVVPFGRAEDNEQGKGVATASFEIQVAAADKIGEIEFYALDKAGNRSDVLQLTKKGDEWAVEKTRPQIIDELAVTSVRENGDTAFVTNNDGKYYSNCTATVTAEDSTSGIYGIIWYVNGTKVPKRVSDTDSKQTQATFTLPINEAGFPTIDGNEGEYEVYAVVEDNAGNQSIETEHINFRVDDVDPVLQVVRDYDVYATSAVVRFTTYDELSGVGHIDVYDSNGNQCNYKVISTEKNEAGYEVSVCSFETSVNGTYRIVVQDKAGNYVEDVISLDKVSDETPLCPTVTFHPEPNQETGWITEENATVNITNVTETQQDKMGVITYYEMWAESDNRPYNPASIRSDLSDLDLLIPGDGVYNLHVWSESLTGQKCIGADEDSHSYVIKLDTQAPDIQYEMQKGSDNHILVTFTVKDTVSGVDREAIKVMHGANEVLTTIEETDNGYVGSFEIAEAGSYQIQASDNAGNKAEAPAFTPMSMKVNAVKNITEHSATIGAKITKGTYGIKTASIAYRKYADTAYIETDAVPSVDEKGNMAISTVLTELVSGTDYVYKVTAVSEGDEVLEYVGHFKTLAEDEVGITITGSARYEDINHEGTITVGLMKGLSCVRAVEVDPVVNNEFTFYNVPDGSYNLVATDGTYSKNLRVLIRDEKLVYPETEIIDLVLSTMSTSVDVQTEETPDISADFNEMDDLLDDDDKLLIESGGTVEYKLTAKLIRVTNVETAALSAMYAAAGTNKVVGAFLDLNLYKITTDNDGDVTTKKVSKLGGGANVSVTIPLGDLTGKPGLTVVRIHQNGDTFTGSRLEDRDNNPSTYTVTTSQFSTYAVLYNGKDNEDSGNNDNTGDKQPPVVDTQYQGDDVINSHNQQSVDKGANAVKLDAKSNSAKASNSSSSLGSLTSSGSAKTGDEAPIGAVSVILIMAMGGLVILRRKTR